MTAKEVVKKLRALGAVRLRSKGSHVRFASPDGRCATTVAMHPGDVPLGTLRAIERQMAPSFGNGWLLE